MFAPSGIVSSNSSVMDIIKRIHPPTWMDPSSRGKVIIHDGEESWFSLKLLHNSVDLDTIDNGKTAIATFELPGVQKSDVKIEVHDCVLTISGEKKMPSPRVKNLHSIHERHYGKFIRSLHLPKGVKVSSALLCGLCRSVNQSMVRRSWRKFRRLWRMGF